MSRLLTVMKFEYLGFAKSKSYIVTTCIIVAAILIMAFMPQIAGAVSGVFDDESDGRSKAAYILTDEADQDGMKQIISNDALDSAIPDFEWDEVDADKSPEKLISDDGYQIVLIYDGGLKYKLYSEGSDLAAGQYTQVLNVFLSKANQTIAAGDFSSEVQTALTEIETIQVTGELSYVGGNASDNYWYAYVLQFGLYLVMVIYGQFIMTAVITEKSSKAMELLVTSAKPMELMFGKVFGIGLVALTQLVLILLSLIVGIRINLSAWEEFMPDIFSAIKSMNLSVDILAYFILFFLIGYFTYAFMYAAFGSTVSKPEEAGSVSTLPVFLLIVVFLVSMASLFNINGTIFKILSYVPFFSPFVMFNRVCMGAVSTVGIWTSILIAVVWIFVIGWIATKIYRVGIMMYGKPMNLTSIVKTIRQN